MSDCSLLEPVKPAAGEMFARARLACDYDARRGCSHVTTLRSDGPIVLRKCNPKGAEPLTASAEGIARVALAAGTAGPIGGDHYYLDVTVGSGSTLLLQEVSAMLILPGSDGRWSHMTIRVTVEDRATFVWWSEPIIAAKRCNHHHDVRISLAETARMVMREELIFGRHGEASEDMRSRLRITRAGRPLYDQRLSVGPSARGWHGAAVTGQKRTVGAILAVDPAFIDSPLPGAAFHRDATLAALPKAGAVIGAAADDSHTLRALLENGLNTLGPPWAVQNQGDR